MSGLIAGTIFELAKKGIKALIENIDFTVQNASSVNIEQRMNEMRGDVYAFSGYVDKMKSELDNAKITTINMERKATEQEGRAIIAELRADKAENRAKELEHEIDELQKYFKGE